MNTEMLSSNYVRTEWISLLRSIFINFDEFHQSKPIQLYHSRNKKFVKSIYLLGQIKIETKVINVYEVFVCKDKSPMTSRTEYKKLIYDVCLKEGDCDAAIATFINQSRMNWRISYMSLERSIKNNKVIERQTAHKRYTYLCGSNSNTRIVSDRLMWLSNKSEHMEYEDVAEAFSINYINNEFYKSLVHWFERAKKSVVFPSWQGDEKPHSYITSCLIKLLTRMMFVWFLKEKNLVHSSLFKYDFIIKVIDYSKPSAYYKGILQNLFFAVLNTEKNKRGVSKQTSEDNNLIKYHANSPCKILLNANEQEIVNLFKEVPFLNGGLFQCLDDVESNELDSFSDNPSNVINVPNDLFFDQKQKKGLIDILNNYQFTTEESTYSDIDLALDPEMLGKVFEKLLTSYNEKSGMIQRKETGSYYTPREIVSYMVDECLKKYCQTVLRDIEDSKAIIKKKINTLFHNCDNNTVLGKGLFTIKEKTMLITKLLNIKILDPAVGSGEFPMGALLRILEIITHLDRDFKTTNNILNINTVTTTHVSTRYQIKLKLIKHCLFGVDIQSVAIQITKLRFFLSLLIEQIVTNKRTRIIPLPNLETKFVIADFLVKQKSIQFLSDYKLYPTIQKFLSLRSQYFSATNVDDKKELIKQYKSLRQQTFELEKTVISVSNRKDNLTEIDLSQDMKEYSFFSSLWMFNIEKDFDVVIGNPPYVQIQKHKYKIKYKHEKYKCFSPDGDLYQLFVENGFDQLNNNGNLCFITSNKWMRARYGLNMRNWLINNKKISVLDLGPDVFKSATVDTNIIHIEKNRQQAKFFLGASIDSINKVYEKIDFTSIPIKRHDSSWSITNEAERDFIKHIQQVGTPLKRWNVNIYFGLKTGFNDAFIIDDKTKTELCDNEFNNNNIIKRVARGREINNYYTSNLDQWLIETHNGWGAEKRVELDDYPKIQTHMQKYIKELENRTDRGKEYYNLRSCSYMKEFEKSKLAWQRITTQPKFSIIDAKIRLLDSTAFLVSDELDYLAGVLNSRLIYKYIDLFVHKLGSQGYCLSNQYVELIPIPLISNKNKRIVGKIKKIVKIIINDIKKGNRIEAHCFKLDQLVIELYNLSDSHIKLISEFKN